MKLGAVIVAAGMSSRMGEFKPLMKIGNKSMIEHVVDTFQDARVDKIILVTGKKGKELKEHLKGKKVTFVENPDYHNTEMFDSAKIGLKELEGTVDKVFFTPGDIPLFQVETLKKLLKAEGTIIKPVCNGRNGHPLLMTASMIPVICSYKGEGGMKGALGAFREEMVRVPVEDEGILHDADTEEEFRVVMELYWKRSKIYPM